MAPKRIIYREGQKRLHFLRTLPPKPKTYCVHWLLGEKFDVFEQNDPQNRSRSVRAESNAEDIDPGKPLWRTQFWDSIFLLTALKL